MINTNMILDSNNSYMYNDLKTQILQLEWYMYAFFRELLICKWIPLISGRLQTPLKTIVLTYTRKPTIIDLLLGPDSWNNFSNKRLAANNL